MRFFSAEQVFDGKDFLPSGTVLAFNDSGAFSEAVPSEKVSPQQVDYFKGILCPGFVNAHCHLELSHLLGKIPRHTGLPAFARHVIQQREASAGEIEDAMKAADKYMWERGIVAVGDICNTPHSIAIKKQSTIHYHSFVELLALNPARSKTVFENGLSLLNSFRNACLRASLAPHAPYSTSNELIQKIADHNAIEAMPLSIHNQESSEEQIFFERAGGGFLSLYAYLNIDVSWFKPPQKSSLAHYGPLLPQTASILVHNTFSGQQDLDVVAEKNIWWCLCPAANLYIENSLPHFSLFQSQWQNICVGTDSLASNTELNLCGEAGLLLSKTNVFSLAQVLRFITYNGAAALGLETQFGSFIPGARCGLNLVEAANDTIQFKQKLV